MDISTGTAKYRKNRKIYYQDPLILHCFSGKDRGIGDGFYTEAKRFLSDPKTKSKLVEGVIAQHVKRYTGQCHYWQGKKEIDFVLKHNNNFTFVEVKYRQQVKPSDFLRYQSMLPNNAKFLVVTRHHTRQDGDIQMIAAPIFLIELEKGKII